MKDTNASAADRNSHNLPTPAILPSPDQSGSRRSDNRRTWPVRRLSIIASILAIGGIALGIAIAILPSAPVVTSLPTYGVLIYTRRSVLTTESLTFKRQANDMVQIQSQGIVNPAGGAPASKRSIIAFVDLEFLGKNTKVVDCPLSPAYCTSAASVHGLNTEINFSLGPYQTETAVIRDQALGFDENGQTAVVQLPYVEDPVAKIPPFTLTITYDVPQANEYDWSVPPASIGPNGATWLETVTPSDAPPGLGAQATEITGSNHAAQAVANDQTFTSGVLFGVVGAAALAAVQEALHLIFDQRRIDEAGADAA